MTHNHCPAPYSGGRIRSSHKVAMTALVACYPANGSTGQWPGQRAYRPVARLPIEASPNGALTPRPISAERDSSGSTKSRSIVYPIQLHGHIPIRHIGPPYYFGPLSALGPIRGHYINTADSPSGISAPSSTSAPLSAPGRFGGLPDPACSTFVAIPSELR